MRKITLLSQPLTQCQLDLVLPRRSIRKDRLWGINNWTTSTKPLPLAISPIVKCARKGCFSPRIAGSICCSTCRATDMRATYDDLPVFADS